MVPKIQKIYLDMLGSGGSLQASAPFRIDHHATLLLGTIALSILAAVLAYRLRSIFHVIVIGSMAILFHVSFGIWVSSALMGPIQQIVQGLVR